MQVDAVGKQEFAWTCKDLYDCSVKREQELHASGWEFTGDNRVKMNLTCENEFNL